MELLQNIIETGINIFDAVLAIDFMIKLNGYQWIKSKTQYIFIAILMFNTYIIPAKHFSVLQILINILICFIFSINLKKSPLTKRLISSVLFFGTLVGINSAVLYFFATLTGKNVAELSDAFGINKITMLIISKIMLFSLTRIYIRYNEKAKEGFKLADMVMMIFIPLLNIFILSVLMEVSIKYKLDNAQSLLITFAVIGIFVSDLIVYYFFIKISITVKLQDENQYLLQQLEYEKKHISETHSLYERISRIKHDIKNHFICIAAFIKESNYERALEYISEIEGQINDIYNYVNTENDILNFIINTKLSIAQNKGINVSANIQNTDLSSIDWTDLCSMLTNMIDNAIEASEKETEKYISIIISKQRAYQVFTVKNKISHSILEQNPQLRSGKLEKSEHGLGIKQIRYVAEKYNGDVDIYEKVDMFCISVLIPE